MQFLLLGFLALAVGLVAVYGLGRINAGAVLAVLRVVVGAGLLGAALIYTLTGRMGLAFACATGAALLLGAGGAWPIQPTAGPSPSGGQSSRVVTDILEMELDHASGEMHGRVLKGKHEGRELSELTPAEIAGLWRDCRFTDPPSAQLLEAYLDRMHPTWREDFARMDGEGSGEGPGSGQPMTMEEAYSVLGLAPGASAEDIRKAHRELMMKVHPDRGGSTYLAAKINAAKELLLGRKAGS
ncbi:MAG: DnaJ domain-containing protein [Hyphomicrobiaceae bacterium]